jgi:hypothetical protein
LADPPASGRPGAARAAILDFVRLLTQAGKAFMPQPIDEDPGKPVHIWTRAGPKPLLAAGNVNRCGARPGPAASADVGGVGA